MLGKKIVNEKIFYKKVSNGEESKQLHYVQYKLKMSENVYHLNNMWEQSVNKSKSRKLLLLLFFLYIKNVCQILFSAL